MNDPKSRPAIAGKVSNMDDYDVIFAGFPIWWYVAPTIIPFATSGGSGMGKTNEKLLPNCQGATLLQGRMLNGNVSVKELEQWIESLKL